jgi:hypothetical protein
VRATAPIGSCSRPSITATDCCSDVRQRLAPWPAGRQLEDGPALWCRGPRALVGQFPRRPLRLRHAHVWPLDRYPDIVSSKQVPGGVVHELPRRPSQGADGQPDRTPCLERHHPSGSQRIHLLGRGCQAADDSRTPHSPDPGGTGGGPAPALLLAGMPAPRAHRPIAHRSDEQTRPRPGAG